MGHLNSAQRNKANPDFKVEGKQMDTNAQRIQIRNSYFCTFKFLISTQESQWWE